MARKLTPLTLPSWISRYNKETKLMEFTGHTSVTVYAYEVSTFFAITKPLESSRNFFKYTITHIVTGMTASGFNKIGDARKCVKTLEENTHLLLGCHPLPKQWGYIDTPEKLMLQRHWVKGVIAGIKNE